VSLCVRLIRRRRAASRTQEFPGIPFSPPPDLSLGILMHTRDPATGGRTTAVLPRKYYRPPRSVDRITGPKPKTRLSTWSVSPLSPWRDMDKVAPRQRIFPIVEQPLECQIIYMIHHHR